MDKEYFRPKTVSEADYLFSSGEKRCIPLGGGTVLSRSKLEGVCLVDLRDLGLDRLDLTGQKLSIGATVTLQQLIESDSIPPQLKDVVRRTASLNVRNQATIGGYIVSAGGRSPLAIALMAMDALLVWHPNEEKQSIGDWFTLRQPAGYWINSVQLNLNANLSYQQVARTPMDQPIIAVAICRWKSGRIRVAVGGFGTAPLLAVDGPMEQGILEAVDNALCSSGDEWATAEYRREAGVVLARRILSETER